MIDFLAPFFTGALRPYAERLHVAAQAQTPRADWAVECLARLSQATRCADLRALAAAWFRDYTMAVVPGALVAAAVHRRRLPFDRAVPRIAQEGWLESLVLPDGGEPAVTTLPALLSPLMNRHLPDVVAALATAGRVSQRLLWCTGGVAASGIARQLAAHPALDAAGRAEVLAWIDHAVSADGYPNPLHGAFRAGMEPGSPGIAPVRRICCLNYRLPAGEHCGTCPRVAVNPVPNDPSRATAATATTR